MADTDYTSVYRQFFEDFMRTVKPEDPLPIGVPPYNVDSCEIIGEIIESCMQYLTINKCPQCLFVPLITIAIKEIQAELTRQNKNEYEPLKVMQICTSKINEICLRFTDNERLSSLPPPVKETYFSLHGIKHTRRRMEDRLICLPRFHSLYDIPCKSEAGYYALFDGHNGSIAATYAVSHLHQYLAESQYYPHDPVSALREAYSETESRYLAKKLTGGTTALVILHIPDSNKLIVSWLGDSQAVLVTQKGYLLLADPHKPGREDEYRRISYLGGFVFPINGSYRVNGLLAVSRAIGDQQLKPYVSADPDIREIELTGTEEFIIIGCDGLWDVVKPAEAIEAVYSQMKEKPNNIESVSRRLVDLAKQNNSTDNISVIVVFLAEPAEISKRSVEAFAHWPRHLSQGEMDSNFQTASESSPFTPLPDQGMNRLYEENGRNTDYMDQLKEDSDEDLGPETDIDAVDDVLLSPSKCKNPFTNDVWKKENSDCDGSHDLIDYSKQEILNKDRDMVNFLDNINTSLKENNENQSVEDLAGGEPLDNLHMNQLNSSYLADTGSTIPEAQNKFSNYNPVKCDNDIEQSVNSDFKDHSFITEREKDFVGVNDFTNFDKFKNNQANEFDAFNNHQEPGMDLMGDSEQIMCNGNAEIHSFDKLDLEKPVSPFLPEQTVPELENKTMDDNVNDTNVISQTNENISETNQEIALDKTQEEEQFLVVTTTENCELPDMTCDLTVSPTPDSTLNVRQALSDTENASPKDPEIETPEVLSPTIPHCDDKLKDDIVAESGGEVDSEDDEWDYIKVGSGAPADEQIDSFAIPPQVAESEKAKMNSPLNPHAAEFVPVSPIANTMEMDAQKTPVRSIPSSVNDIIASSPNWNNMDNVDIPDEVSFFSEIKSRPSNIFSENDLTSNDMEGLGCADLNVENKENPGLYQGIVTLESPISEKLAPEVDASPTEPMHGIGLASDMISSFIDTSTMSAENDMSKEFGIGVEEKEPPPNVESFSTLNADAAEFKSVMMKLTSEAPNKLPDLLSSFPTAEEPIQANETSEVPLLETSVDDTTLPIATNVESTSLTEKFEDVKTSPINPPENLDNQMESEKSEKVEAEEIPACQEVKPVVEVPPVSEEIVKPEVGDASPDAELAGAAATVGAVAAGAVVAAEIVNEKKEESKKVASTPKTPTTASKALKSTATPKTPPGATRTTPAAKKPTPLTSKTPNTKPVNSTVSSAVSTKPVASRVTTTTKTPTTKPATSTTAPRPLVRRSTPTTPTTISKATTTATAKPLASKPSTASSKVASAVTSKVTSTVAAPKPKPRVPSAPIEKKSSTTETKRPESLTKKSGVTSSTVTSTTRTTTSRPVSAPVKSTVKTTTTVTTTRTTTTKPRTALTGATTTTTTTTTRTVLNSKKPLSVTSKDVGNKPLSKTVVSKVNGLANGNATKTKKTTVTSTATSKTKIESKTETKAENVLDESVNMIQKENENPVIENNKEVNLMNGLSHD